MSQPLDVYLWRIWLPIWQVGKMGDSKNVGDLGDLGDLETGKALLKKGLQNCTGVGSFG
ncbi:MAG: hypothetical protein J2P46_22745 [Zavarzinella sp.]|nr:hypothetical protein [Zavarzinella sp.]